MKRWKPKYKFKIKRIYFAKKSLRLNYDILVKEHSWLEYRLNSYNTGSSLKTFLTKIYYAKVKHELYLFFKE